MDVQTHVVHSLHEIQIQQTETEFVTGVCQKRHVGTDKRQMQADRILLDATYGMPARVRRAGWLDEALRENLRRGRNADMKNDLMYHVQMRKQQDIEDLKVEVRQLKEENEAIRMGLDGNDERGDKLENQFAELHTNFETFKRQTVKRQTELQRGLQFTLMAVLIGYVLGIGTILL